MLAMDESKLVKALSEIVGKSHRIERVSLSFLSSCCWSFVLDSGSSQHTESLLTLSVTRLLVVFDTKAFEWLTLFGSISSESKLSERPGSGGAEPWLTFVLRRLPVVGGDPRAFVVVEVIWQMPLAANRRDTVDWGVYDNDNDNDDDGGGGGGNDTNNKEARRNCRGFVCYLF